MNLTPTIEEFGAKLFESIFRDEIRVALATSLEKAESDNAGLRIRLRLVDAPELADLPWEFAYDRSARRFLALSGWTPLVRYLEMPGRVRPLPVSPPLRILIVEASPVDLELLDSADENERLHDALADLIAAGLVVLDEEPTGTFAGLQRQLRRAEYHILHFIGHGGFDEDEDDGVLYFEGPKRRSQAVTGRALGELLHDHRSLRLAVLNACEGARSGRKDPFAGTAQSLVRQGIPAVVAMQFEITDGAAITFARTLYEAVADGYPLDASMAEARKSVKSMPNPIEWATPVLHMRAGDGRVFAVDATAEHVAHEGSSDLGRSRQASSRVVSDTPPVIRTPDQRVRVFVSSTLRELENERRAAREAIERMRLAPVMFELGARPHPPRALYRAYLAQSDIFIGIYAESYGWVAPDEEVSGVEDEYNLAPPAMPKLIYIRSAAHRDERLERLIARIQTDDTAACIYFGSPKQLEEMIQGDLATLLAARYD